MELVYKEKQQIKYWFYSSDSMEKISEKFSRAFNSEIIDIDFENVYEWSQQTVRDVYVNISRDHTDARVRSPVLIFFQHYDFEDGQIKSFGMMLKKLFQTHIYRGDYTLQNNDSLQLLEVFEIYN